MSFASESVPPESPVDVASPLRGLRGVLVFASCALVLAVLYWTRAVLMPIALAVLLSFLLSPLVRGFERIGLGRIGSVAVAVLIAFCLIGGVVGGVFTQVTRLANDLPGYRSNIRAKVADLQGVTKSGVIDKLKRTVDDVMAAYERGRRTPRLEPGADEEPVPVVMETSVLWTIPTLLEGLASAGLVLVLVIFMLLERRELRDRVIRLLGYGHLAVTTRALDEAAGRISRYLVAQSLINAGYGVAIGVGLSFLGLPYALLWGFLAAVLRFIPYIGPWLGAGLPVMLSLAAFAGWSTPLSVILLFVAVEIVTNLIVEPLAYGQSAGVSQVALLAAIAFWTWLWGPIGLVLATPLTVCVVVLSKHVPGLEFIFFLMVDEPVLEPEVRLYQRLLAADLEEAMEVVDEHRRAKPDADPRETLLLPALVRARMDRESHALSRDEEQRLYQSTRHVLAALAEHAPGDGAGRAPGSAAEQMAQRGPASVTGAVLGCPADGEGAEIVLQVLSDDLAQQGVALELLWSGADSLELLARVEEADPRIVCIAALPPRGTLAARYLCRRLRQQFPRLSIVALAIGEDGSALGALRGSGATVVASTLAEASAAIVARLRADGTTAAAAPIAATS